MVSVLRRPSVVDAIERSADPITARVALERLTEAHTGLDAVLAAHPRLVDALVAVSVASRSLLAGMLVDAQMVEVLRDVDVLERELAAPDFGRRLQRVLTGTDDAAATLRRWKRRELVRIAARDLLGLADLRHRPLLSLSGGQRQRLALARALLRDPEVLVLVEPTSAVDAHTEARIAERVSRMRRGRTTVVTTVSPLWLHHADRVVLLHDGTVVAEGDHAQLLEENPEYRHLVARGLDEVTVGEAGR